VHNLDCSLAAQPPLLPDMGMEIGIRKGGLGIRVSPAEKLSLLGKKAKEISRVEALDLSGLSGRQPRFVEII